MSSDVPPTPPIMVGGYGTAGGYKFSEDEIDSVIKQWEDLLAHMNDDLTDARKIKEVQPPAKEFASEDFVSQGANPSGETLLQQHQRMYDYVNNFITALRAAKNKIKVSEQENRDQMNKQAKGA
ncbi:hypothetical protein G3I59_16715 [Amycolatopsis rubida]|uniref:PE domain-containing protein n=1 Tax=Amycolatopsis rubida TaxID=112413 RepID=A0ABX0BS03_9PSEU|nr:MULTISPECIES: hypothetical protein [Amycolatopsis]MYW92198.1 hypothetical protein [Amycolatopsis rubida]NEC57185.1 hypothetical protein [Amycolatopsis rubida]OAP27051.1 hypothetical protein A4R44_01856 [Amycolatopsis sp. M39]